MSDCDKKLFLSKMLSDNQIFSDVNLSQTDENERSFALLKQPARSRKSVSFEDDSDALAAFEYSTSSEESGNEDAIDKNAIGENANHEHISRTDQLTDQEASAANEEGACGSKDDDQMSSSDANFGQSASEKPAESTQGSKLVFELPDKLLEDLKNVCSAVYICFYCGKNPSGAVGSELCSKLEQDLLWLPVHDPAATKPVSGTRVFLLDQDMRSKIIEVLKLSCDKWLTEANQRYLFNLIGEFCLHHLPELAESSIEDTKNKSNSLTRKFAIRLPFDEPILAFLEDKIK